MASLHHTRLSPTLFVATTSQTGFPASNVGSSYLARPWRATGNLATDIDMHTVAATTVKTLHVHDVNFTAATVYKSPDGVAWVLVGALATYMGKEGRRRGKILINDANDANVKAVRISIAAGASTDGLPWRIGFAPLFAASITIPPPFQFAYQARFTYPQLSADLANGRDAIASTGIGFHTIQVPFKPRDTEELEEVLRRARAGACLLDLELANFPWQLWPVQHREGAVDEGFNVPKESEVTLTFREVV